MGTVSGDQPTPDKDDFSPDIAPKSTTGPRSIQPIKAAPRLSDVASKEIEAKALPKADLTQKEIVPKSKDEVKKEVLEAIEQKTIDVAVNILKTDTSLEKDDLLQILQSAYGAKSDELIGLTIDRGALPTATVLSKAINDKDYDLLEKLLSPYKGKEPRIQVRMLGDDKMFGSTLLTQCIEANDAKALRMLAEIIDPISKSADGSIQARLADLPWMTNTHLTVEFLKQEKQLGIKPPENPRYFLSTIEPSMEPHTLYLIGEQYFGWDRIFSDPKIFSQFCDLFQAPACNLPDDLRPLLEVSRAKGKADWFFDDCWIRGTDVKASRTQMAAILWEMANDPAIREKIMKSHEGPLEAHIIVTYCLDDFLKSDVARTAKFSSIYREALATLPENDPALSQLFDLVVKEGVSFSAGEESSILVQAAERGYFETYFKMVAAEIDAGAIYNFGRYEECIPSDDFAKYNEAKSRSSPEIQALIAVQRGDLKQLQALAATPVNFKDPKLMSQAVMNDHWHVVDFLIGTGASFTPQDHPDLKDVFIFAINSNLPGLVPKLVAQGWDINKAGSSGYLPIIRAHSCPEWKEMLTVFVNAGADINRYDWQGFAPIHYASSADHPDSLAELIRLGADTSKETHQGETALHLAIKHNVGTNIEVLKSNGASLMQVALCGTTPLEYALFQGAPMAIPLLENALGTNHPQPIAERDFQFVFALVGNDLSVTRSRIVDAAKVASEETLLILLHLAFLLHDKESMQAVQQKLTRTAFDTFLGKLQKSYTEKELDALSYCMYSLIPDHYKAGQKRADAEVTEEQIDPNSLSLPLQDIPTEVAEKVTQLVGKVKDGKLPSGIENVAPDDIHEANKAYYGQLNPVQILFKSQRLLALIPDSDKRVSFLQQIAACESSEALHKVYMDIVQYHVSNEFSQINFTDPDKPNYREPSKITFFGVVKTKEELIKNLEGMIRCVKNRTPYTGTPPEKTQELEQFYRKLEAKLDDYVQELVTHQDIDQKATVQLDLAKEVSQCSAKWIQYVSQSGNTLRGKFEVVSFEDKFYQVLQDYRSGIIHEMVTEGNVHEYNHYVSQVGQELNLPDADTFIGYKDMFADQFKTKDEIRTLFDKRNPPERNIAFTKGFLAEQYKTNRDLCIDWFTSHIPPNYNGTPLDYLEEEVFDEKFNFKPTAVLHFLQSLSTPVLSSPVEKG